MVATASSLMLRLDPRSPDTGERIDQVSERIRGARARTQLLSGRIAELTRQFLDDDLVQKSGPEEGRPLAREGRIQWLSQLVGLHRSYCGVCHEEAELHALLRRMEESVRVVTTPEPL